MIVYLDTEFTGFRDPHLISAGLVCGDDELYFEVAGISLDLCTPFVIENVLPFLSGKGLSPTEISAKMATFLAQCGPEVTFLCDAPRYDVALIKPFIPATLRWHYSVPTFPTEVQFDAFTEDLQFELDTLRQHHALDDARALAKIWRKFHPHL